MDALVVDSSGVVDAPPDLAATGIDWDHYRWAGDVCLTADSVEMEHLVRALKAAGADLLKTSDLGPKAYFALAAAARRAGLRFGGHAKDVSPFDAADSGASLIDHATSPAVGVLASLCFTPKATVEQCRPVAERFRRTNTWSVPTLIRGADWHYRNASSDVIPLRLEKTVADFWADFTYHPTWLHHHAPLPRPTVSDSLPPFADLTIPMQVGLPILVGGDTRDRYAGFATHAEMAIMVDRGLTPLAALQAATLNPARMLRVTDSLGTVAAGKLADLVLLDADPLADITNTTTIRAVVANGRYFDRATLDKLLVESRTRAHAGVAPHPPWLALSYQPIVAPFPVIDSAGYWLQLAFAGGLNAPHPQLADADGDGRLDLFVQERPGEVALYQQGSIRLLHPDGSHLDSLLHFTFQTAKYGGVDVGDWYRFADIDDDGDLDLLTGPPAAHHSLTNIRYYRNDGTRSIPKFVLAADTLRDAAGAPILADASHVPQSVDLDCNGRPDLLVGRADGTVARYEAVRRVAPRAVPVFQLMTPDFADLRLSGKEGKGDGGTAGNPKTTVPTGRHPMALADYDQDGDLDLFWGSDAGPDLFLMPNTGTCAAPTFGGRPERFSAARLLDPFGIAGLTFGDVDGDRRIDMVVGVGGRAPQSIATSAENLYYLHRVVADGLVNQDEWNLGSRQMLPMIDVGRESAPAVGDLDGDGDLDLLLANQADPSDSTTARVYWFKNVGTRTLPVLRLNGSLAIPGPIPLHAAPALGDLDGDGQLDLLLGAGNGRVAWYRQQNGRFEVVDTALVPSSRDSNSTPTLGDLDGDGDLDLVVGHAGGGLSYYRNDGTKTHPRFVLMSDAWGGIAVGHRSAPHLVDIDGDGDLDLLIGSAAEGVVLYRNVGTRTAPRFERDPTFKITAPALATPVTGDFDGDGDPDLIVGGVGGGAVYLERR